MRRGSQEIRIAYKVPGPKEYLMLEVRYSANAWWMDKEKVFILLRAFKEMTRLRDACVMAGITLKQYRYFARLHPIIEERRKVPYLVAGLKVKMTWVKSINAGDKRASMKWLEITAPETFRLRRRRATYGTSRTDREMEYRLTARHIEKMKERISMAR
jgi:hypothetical protein